MKFDTIITTIVWLALSFDTAAGRKSSKSRKQKKCSQVLYYDPQENIEQTQLYSAGLPALGNQLCAPIFPFPCSGDRAIISPTTVYEDDGLLNRVGFFTRVANYVNGEGQTVFTSAIVFDEGPNAGSEIVSSGSYGTIVDIFLESGLVFPISGGVGNFVGASGDVAQKATGDKRSLIINCL